MSYIDKTARKSWVSSIRHLLRTFPLFVLTYLPPTTTTHHHRLPPHCIWYRFETWKTGPNRSDRRVRYKAICDQRAKLRYSKIDNFLSGQVFDVPFYIQVLRLKYTLAFESSSVTEHNDALHRRFNQRCTFEVQLRSLLQEYSWELASKDEQLRATTAKLTSAVTHIRKLEGFLASQPAPPSKPISVQQSHHSQQSFLALSREPQRRVRREVKRPHNDSILNIIDKRLRYDN